MKPSELTSGNNSTSKIESPNHEPTLACSPFLSDCSLSLSLQTYHLVPLLHPLYLRPTSHCTLSFALADCESYFRPSCFTLPLASLLFYFSSFTGLSTPLFCLLSTFFPDSTIVAWIPFDAAKLDL